MPTLDQVMKMTDEEVRIALAKYAGYRLIQRDDGEFALIAPNGEDEWADFDPSTTWESCIYVLPNYPASLDALQPIKEGLTQEQKEKFAENLYSLSPAVVIATDEGVEWASIADIINQPASIQSRAILAAVME